MNEPRAAGTQPADPKNDPLGEAAQKAHIRERYLVLLRAAGTSKLSFAKAMADLIPTAINYDSSAGDSQCLADVIPLKPDTDSGGDRMTIQITRTEFSAAELRHRARVASDPDQARRLLAIASILDGASRTDAAKSAGMERQTLRDWVHRYNAEGVDGLKDRQRTGRKPLLDGEQRAKLDELVETPPDPVKDGVVPERTFIVSGKRSLPAVAI
jgi:transposase-like protein